VLTRYVLRRWATPFLGALFFYGFLLLSWEMVALSKEIFAQGAPLRWLLPLLLTALPENLGMVLPMAAVLGGLLGTQQLMEGSELVAAQGLGAGNRTWTAPWVILASILILLASANAHVAVPYAARLQQTLRGRMAEEAKARFLRPGAPPWSPPGAAHSSFWVSPEGQVHLMEVGPTGTQHLTASRMTYALQPQVDGASELQIHLTDLQGALFQGTGSGSVVHLRQEQQTLRFAIPTATRLLPPTPLRYETSGRLVALLRGVPKGAPDPGDLRLKAAVELARRTTLPIAAAALLLLGIAMGFTHPRFYRGGAILKSIGVIMLYYLLMKYIENMWIGGKVKTIIPLLALPFPFLLGGGYLLRQRLRPHHSLRTFERIGRWLFRPLQSRLTPSLSRWRSRRDDLSRWLHGKGTQHGILQHWSTLAWWRNWGSVLGSLLVLNGLVEYASLAGDLSKNQIQITVFITYWLWNLPPFLVVALPLAFLLGTLLTLSEAALNREWLALRAGGVSLLTWLWSSRWAWGAVTLLTFGLQVGLAPVAKQHSDSLYRRILARSQVQSTEQPWLHLGATGVLWHLDADERWGFPLKSPGEAPILLRWRLGDSRSEALPWGGLQLVPGPAADQLFPDRALRNAPTAEVASTWDLLRWQVWAPNPDRAYMLGGRALGWMAGPCLVLAMLSFSFPGPRQGRGQAVGFGLVGGLVFLGLQTLFGGAARAGQIPASWGIMAPFLLLISTAFLRLHRLRT
jgi:lipopolysaccharide export LptBFGC system permease protein LptF